MSTYESIEPASVKLPSYGQIDRAIRGLKDIEPENTLLPVSFGGNLQRLVRIYSGVKPLLTVLTALPIIPSKWRSALAVFNQALEAVVSGAGDIGADFKAGKDL